MGGEQNQVVGEDGPPNDDHELCLLSAIPVTAEARACFSYNPHSSLCYDASSCTTPSVTVVCQHALPIRTKNEVVEESLALGQTGIATFAQQRLLFTGARQALRLGGVRHGAADFERVGEGFVIRTERIEGKSIL